MIPHSRLTTFDPNPLYQLSFNQPMPDGTTVTQEMLQHTIKVGSQSAVLHPDGHPIYCTFKSAQVADDGKSIYLTIESREQIEVEWVSLA